MERLISLDSFALVPGHDVVWVEKQEDLELVWHKTAKPVPEITLNTKVNNFRNINRILKNANEKLPIGGIVYGYYESIEQRQHRLKTNCRFLSPKYRLTYDFVIRRLIPKLTPFRQIDNVFALVRNRSLSDCEMLGRLAYCGFRIIEHTKDEKYSFFRAEKIKDPSTEPEKYGVLIRIPRVGKNGKTIKVFKLRTMYPFAKYLHSYIMSKNGFDKSGKVLDDFRVPGWSGFLRKHWLDELPQLLNLLSGDIKLFGVRPISRDMYMRYPKDLQLERIKTKPGLIPPYYVDMPKSFEEIINSERRYLRLRKEKPFKTDFKYFWKAFNNIVFKGARSS